MSKEVNWSEFHGEGEIECECDSCGKTEIYGFDGGYPDFLDFQKELKLLGWVSRKIDNDWYDFCGRACHQKFMNKRTGWNQN